MVEPQATLRRRIKDGLKTRMPPAILARMQVRTYRRKYLPFTTPAKERNYVRAQQDYLSKRVHVRSLPYLAIVDPANLCNLRCPFCPTNKGEFAFSNAKIPKALHRDRVQLTLERFGVFLDAFGETLYSMDLFNWGEPLLNGHVVEMVAMASKRKIQVRMSSNLNVREPDLAQRICESGLDTFIISLDGIHEETYKTYRRGGDFDLVVRNLASIAAYKKRYGFAKPALICQFLVFKHNEHEIPEVGEFARLHGADATDIATAYIYHPDWIPESDAYRPKEAGFEGICPWLWSTATLEATGTLSPCCLNRDARYDFGAFASVKELRDLWNGDGIRRSRNYYHTGKPDARILCDCCPLILPRDLR